MAIHEAVRRETVARPWLLAWVSLLPLVALRSGTLAESDTFWAIRAGRVTMADGAIPTVDTFSWTAAGDPWTLNSWGFNVVLAVAHGAAGLVGVSVISAAMVAGILGLALLLARRAGAHPVVAAVVLQVVSLTMVGFFSARPQLVDYAAVLVLVLILDRILRGCGVPVAELCAAAAVSVVWVNLHAATPIGLAILAGAGVLALVVPDARHRAGWCFAACGVATTGSLLNPYGADVLAQSFRVADASTALIVEWQPLNPTDPFQLAMFLPGVVALVIAVRRRDVAYTAALGVLALGSIQAMRILPILALVAVPVLASAASNPSIVRYIHSRRVMLTQGAIVCMIALGVIGGLSLANIGQPKAARFSPGVVDAIPKGCDLYNSYAIGGYVILARPDVRVSIDSRNDMYGVDRVRASGEQLNGRPGDFLNGADCVLIPANSALAGWLRGDNEWTLAASDKANTLFVR